jgi:microcin C transport system substrate-binding protein
MNRTSKNLTNAFTLAVAILCASSAHANLGNPNAPQGGNIVLNLGVEPPTLNPITSTDAAAQEVQAYVIESMGTRNVDTYEWEPALATSWEISKDNKTFTFKLRPGVKWHDGKPLTAEDVKFSFDVIFDKRFEASTGNKRPYYEDIEKVEVIDAQTVKFTCKKVYFRNFDTAIGMFILPKHVYGDPDTKVNLNHILVGSGAYQLEKFEKGKRIVLKKTPDHWSQTVAALKGLNNFERITLRFVKEDAVLLEMLKKGDLDYDGLTSEAYSKKAVGPEWGKKVFKVQTKNSAPKPYGYIAWNLTNPLFQDKNVRVALAHLMNRKLMIEKFRDNLSIPATGPWYQQSDYASKNVKPIEYDPKKASDLLKKAGWKDENKNGILEKTIGGKKTEMNFTILTANPDFIKYITLYKEDAKQQGVHIEIKQLEWNAFLKVMDEGKFEAINLGWGAGAVDVDPKQIWHSDSAVKGGSNFIGYKNKKVDTLIDQARATMDKQKRVPLLQNVYEIIADEAPYLFLFNDIYTFYAHTPRMGRVKDTYTYAVETGYWYVKE